MRNVLILVAFIATIVAVFFLGRMSNDWRTEVRHNADGILAYQHYFEAAENILSDEEAPDSAQWAEYCSAKEHIQEYHANVIMTWPDIINQRDMLSDAIRCFADHHQNIESPDDNIFNYVSEFGINPEVLSKWAYSY